MASGGPSGTPTAASSSTTSNAPRASGANEYADPRGFPTIGYGIKLPLTKTEGELLLVHRLEIETRCIAERWPPWRAASRAVQDALRHAGFVLGCTGLLEFTKALQALALSDYRGRARRVPPVGLVSAGPAARRGRDRPPAEVAASAPLPFSITLPGLLRRDDRMRARGRSAWRGAAFRSRRLATSRPYCRREATRRGRNPNSSVGLGYGGSHHAWISVLVQVMAAGLIPEQHIRLLQRCNRPVVDVCPDIANSTQPCGLRVNRSRQDPLVHGLRPPHLPYLA